MRTRIVKIGNSRGVRIPKVLLEHVRLSEHVEIEVRNEQIVIRSANHPRDGWDEAFRRMSLNGDDVLPDWQAASLTTWDEDEWQW
jgi:antitoxin MazE